MAGKSTTPQADAETADQAGPKTAKEIGETVKGKGIYAKLAAVVHHVGAVEKTGKVNFGNTRFAHMQEHGLIEALRPLLRECGLAVFIGAMGPDSWRREANTYFIDVAITVADVEESPGPWCPQEITRHFPNIGVDQQDKGLNKAYTGATKYALQKFFLVPTEGIDDNETVSVDAEPQAKPAAGGGKLAPPASIAAIKKSLLEAHQEKQVPHEKSKAWVMENIGRRPDEFTPEDVTKVAQWLTAEMAAADAKS